VFDGLGNISSDSIGILFSTTDIDGYIWCWRI